MQYECYCLWQYHNLPRPLLCVRVVCTNHIFHMCDFLLLWASWFEPVRWVQEERQIVTDPCDNRIIVRRNATHILMLRTCLSVSQSVWYTVLTLVWRPSPPFLQRFNNCCQILACFCHILACLCEGFDLIAQVIGILADIVYLVTSGCMQAQTCVELSRVNPPTSRLPASLPTLTPLDSFGVLFLVWLQLWLTLRPCLLSSIVPNR